MTDESADDWDPYVVRFDNAKDPVNYSAKQMEAAHRALHYALNNVPRNGESYSKRTELVFRSVSACFREGRLAARFVGGLSGSRTFRGDNNERPTLAPVSSDVQRQAVQLIAQHCLAPGAFALPSDVMENLSFDMADSENASWTAPLREYISSQQQSLVAMLMAADTTDRIAENSYKLAGKPGSYQLTEHYGTLVSAIFSEVGKNQPIGALRRDLQRFALQGLMTQADARPGQVNTDVRMIASDTLRRLDARYTASLASGKGLDDMTKLYLRDTKDILDRFMARQATAK